MMSPATIAETLLTAGTMEPPAAALHYAGNGVKVFPCDPVKKSPLISGGFKNATTDPEQVREWWKQWPAALIGGPTGESFDVLDLDGKEAQESFRHLMKEQSANLSDCFMVQTPRAGGWHVYFTPSDFKCDAGQVAPKVDRRGKGGYIILPGSRRPDGLYKPHKGELRPAPLWLVEAGKKTVQAKQTAAHEKEEKETPPFTESEVREMLDSISPDSSYSDWIAVGMALKAGGFTIDLWDNWSRRGDKYKEGEPAEKWETFEGEKVTIGTLFHMAEAAGYVPPLRAAAKSRTLKTEADTEDEPPALYIPNGQTATVAKAAKVAALVLDGAGDTFNRGGLPMEAVNGELVNLSAPVLVGRIEPPLCRVFRWEVDKEGNPRAVRCMLTEASATRILVHRAFRSGLPPLKYLSRCPVLLADKNGVRTVEGYDRAAGVLVQGWEDGPLPDMTREEAAALLLDMLKDFRFQTPSDKSRALALMLTPAFLAGDMLGGRAPVGLIEADASQTGKGETVRTVGNLYNTEPANITQRKGGVGGLEESFSAAAVKGAPVICLDNLRGKLDSPLLESATTEATFAARVPYAAPVQVDVTRLLLLATSNRAELSPDMANRVCAVRLRKQPLGYNFTRWPAGKLQDEIRANRPRYLSAVLTIARAWVEAGKPGTDETRISGTFRAWCRPMDWICRNYFGLPPLMDGNEEAQTRAANPGLNWIRDLALAAKGAGCIGGELQAVDILNLIEDYDLEPATPPKDGREEEAERTAQLQAIGRRMKKAFMGGEVLSVDGFTVHRWEVPRGPGETHPRKLYRFTEDIENETTAPDLDADQMEIAALVESF